jgi:GT2 family glycosyltransferase
MTDIAAIISLWKRNYLEEQLESLLAQTIPPRRILLVQNEAGMLDVEPVLRKFAGRNTDITCVKSDVNFKYFFRFAIGSLVQNEYLFFVDDDIIPGKHWLELCVEKSRQYNAIISPTGRIIPKDSFRPEKMFIYRRPERYVAGDVTDEEENSSAEDRHVDYGCNSYFIRSE